LGFSQVFLVFGGDGLSFSSKMVVPGGRIIG